MYVLQATTPMDIERDYRQLHEIETFPLEADVVFFEDNPSSIAFLSEALKLIAPDLNVTYATNLQDADALLSTLENGGTKVAMAAFVDGNLGPDNGGEDGRQIVAKLNAIRKNPERQWFEILNFASNAKISADNENNGHGVMSYKNDYAAFLQKLREFNSLKKSLVIV